MGLLHYVSIWSLKHLRPRYSCNSCLRLCPVRCSQSPYLLFVKCSLLGVSTIQQVNFCCFSPLVSGTYPLRPFLSFRYRSHYLQCLEEERITEFSAHTIIKSCPSPYFLETCVWESAQTFTWKYIQLNENNYKSRVLYCQPKLVLFSVKNLKPSRFEYSSNEYKFQLFNVFSRGRGKRKLILLWESESLEK